LIDHPNVAPYEQYREKLAADHGAVETLRRAERLAAL
jgi:hypothetical protein